MGDLCLRGRIVNFKDASGTPEQLFTYYEDGVLEIVNGRVSVLEHADLLRQQGFALEKCEQLKSGIIMPGFIDPHVHAPQLDVIACYGEQLLDWLNKYTFPAETKFSDPQYSLDQTRRFIDLLLANGTTNAMVFTTIFKHNTEQLFEVAAEKNMRLIAGKVLMDSNAPPALLDQGEYALEDCRNLIERWHNTHRLGYALTPRFAGTSTPQQLQALGELAKSYPDVWLQTHLSETQNEIDWTLKLFPQASDYLNVYELFGLVHEKSIFAHCIHLNANEIGRLYDRGSSIAFCPSSNLFLGSGLFDFKTLFEMNIPIGLASDIGGGTSLCQLNTMADAYKVCQLKGYSLSSTKAFYLATLGAARALHIDQFVGSLDPGKEADFIVLDTKAHSFVRDRCKSCKTIEEELFVYMTIGDNRLIARTYIAGSLSFQQDKFSEAA